MLASQMLGSCREMDFLDRETWGLLSLDLDVNLLRPRMDVEVVVGGSGKGTRWNESGLGKRHPGAPPATPIDLMGIILAIGVCREEPGRKPVESPWFTTRVASFATAAGAWPRWPRWPHRIPCSPGWA